MLPSSFAEILCRILILLIIFPAHELAHAVAATRMGDPTPGARGRLTLNPIKHLDPVGAAMFLFVGIGWASTPVNPMFFGENRRVKMGLVSLAGPAVNLLLGILGAVPFYLFGWTPDFINASLWIPEPAYFFSFFIVLNLLLAFFNLIPIAPLDGAQVLGALLPERWAETYDSLQRYGFYALLVLFFILPSFNINLITALITVFVDPLIRLLFSGLR